MSTDAPTDQIDELTELRARIATLEAENADLRGEPVVAAAAPARRPGLWRGILSALFIVIATILVPISIVGTWARVQLVDETSFVATFAPLASDPAVQDAVIDQVTVAINDSIDLEGITNDLFDGLAGLDLPPRASAAIQLLRVPAAQGLQNLVDTAVTRLVQSDAFETVWSTALLASHRALEAAASGGTASGAVVIGDDGEVGIQLGPIIEEVKQRLVDQGVGFAANIPTIDKTIVIAQSDALVTVGVVYNIAVSVGWWLPLVALALFVAGILIARRRIVAVAGSGIGLAIGGGVLAIALTSAGAILALSAPQLGVSAAAIGAVYGQVVAAMQNSALVITTLGVVLALLAWLQGRSRPATATRSGAGAVNAGLRRGLQTRGLRTGAFGRWMYAQRVLVRIVLAAVLILWLLSLRPLGFGDLALVLIVGLLAWWATELVQERPGEALDPVLDGPEPEAPAEQPDVSAEDSDAPPVAAPATKKPRRPVRDD